jgi:hypothetical protein
MNELVALLQDLQRKRFWGSVELEFRDGDVAVVRKAETIKLHKGNAREQQLQPAVSK